MSSLNISLPEGLKDYVAGRVDSGDWSTPSEYVRDLIRKDKERRLRELEDSLTAAAKMGAVELSESDLRGDGFIEKLRRHVHSK